MMRKGNQPTLLVCTRRHLGINSSILRPTESMLAAQRCRLTRTTTTITTTSTKTASLTTSTITTHRTAIKNGEGKRLENVVLRLQAMLFSHSQQYYSIFFWAYSYRRGLFYYHKLKGRYLKLGPFSSKPNGKNVHKLCC